MFHFSLPLNLKSPKTFKKRFKKTTAYVRAHAHTLDTPTPTRRSRVTHTDDTKPSLQPASGYDSLNGLLNYRCRIDAFPKCDRIGPERDTTVSAAGDQGVGITMRR